MHSIYWNPTTLSSSKAPRTSPRPQQSTAQIEEVLQATKDLNTDEVRGEIANQQEEAEPG